jgi:diacylglycerol kinase family enzyme
MRVFLVHNRSSGDSTHGTEELKDLLASAGHTVIVDVPAGSAADADVVVVAGGDGTVAEVAQSLAQRQTPIALLPTGTANNIADWLGLKGLSHRGLVDGWKTGKIQPFDVGRARGPWGTAQFFESFGVGLLSRAMQEIDEGPAGYVNSLDDRDSRIHAARDVLSRLASDSEPIRCQVSLDDHVLDDEYVLAEVLNFGGAGPNLRFSSHADASDGLLDVYLLPPSEREHFVGDLRRDRANAGPHLVTAGAVHRARHVRVTCETSVVHLDDQIWSIRDAAPLSVEVWVNPGELHFLVPG